jgi:hypothetical protein
MRTSLVLLALFWTGSASAQRVWFEDRFNRAQLGDGWTVASGSWKTDGEILKINTSEYDQLVSSHYYLHGTSPFSIEVTLRGIRAGVFFNLETPDSKALSHMVRFDERSILTGHMNAAGEYTATNVFDVGNLPTEWTALRIEVDPGRRQYKVLVNGKLVGVDDRLVFGSGYFGLQASDGVSEFRSARITAPGENTRPTKSKKRTVVRFQHVDYVQTIGKNVAIYNPGEGVQQALDSDGRLVDESVLKMRPHPQREVMAAEYRYVIDGKRILVKNEVGVVIDSITERLVAPSCVLTDYATVQNASPSLYVSDPGANAIHQFGLNGKHIRTFTASTVGGFVAARGMDFYGEDQLVVADYNRLVFINKSLKDENPEVGQLGPTRVKIVWPRATPERPSARFSIDGKQWTRREGSQQGDRNTVILSNLQPVTRYSYKLSPTLKVLPPDAGGSKEFRFSTPPEDSSMMSLARLRVMCMVYRTISYRDVYPKDRFPQVPDGRTISDDELNYLRDACKFNTEFYFRNSSCKVVLDCDFFVVEDTLWLHELGDKDPYWLSCNERVTRDYEKAVQHFGRKPTDYDGLVCPYAWVNHPPRRTSALRDPSKSDSINIRQAYGGGTNGVPAPWKYGKTTGYTGNPFPDRFSRQDWLITHEFHHQIDALMEASGYPDYYHADQPWKMPGRFGEDFDFNARIIRNAELDWWPSLKFGTLAETKDTDQDGVPDDDQSLPFDEKRLSGNPTKKDTDGDGLNDLQEVMAGTSRGCLLDNKDSDGDGLVDSVDPEPLFLMIPEAHKSASGNMLMVIRGGMFDHNGNVYASVSYAWNDTALLFQFHIPDTAGALLQIDANNDGWFHGFDNFQIRIRCRGDSAWVSDYYLRDCSSWVRPPVDRKDILIPGSLQMNRTRLIDGSSILLLSISRNDNYGLDLHPGKNMAIRLAVQRHDDRWVWDELFEGNYMMTVELK